MTDHLTRVRIRDYQSLAEADFEPGPLTVIVGDNDAGKTAIMRAIRAACFNETGSTNIRRGQEHTDVLLEFADDIAGRWRKTRGGGAEYRLWSGEDKLDFSKLGAAVPPEIQSALRIAEIEVSKDFRIQPQFHPQEEYYFLLDRPEGQAARALAKMTKLDIVVEAQQLIRTDLKRAKAELKAAEDNIVRLTLDLTVYEGLADDIVAADKAERLLAEARLLADSLDDMRAAWDAVEDLRVEKAALRSIPSADAVSILKAQYNTTREQVVLWREYAEARDRNTATPDASQFVVPATLRADYDALVAMRSAYQAHFIAEGKAIDIEDELTAHDERTSADRKRWRELKTCPECGQPLGAV